MEKIDAFAHSQPQTLLCGQHIVEQHFVVQQPPDFCHELEAILHSIILKHKPLVVESHQLMGAIAMSSQLQLDGPATKVVDLSVAQTVTLHRSVIAVHTILRRPPHRLVIRLNDAVDTLAGHTLILPDMGKRKIGHTLCSHLLAHKAPTNH